MSIMEVTRPLLTPWTTIDGITVPLHSRIKFIPIAIPMSAGIAIHPCGWIAAKRKETINTLPRILMAWLNALLDVLNWRYSTPRKIVSSTIGAAIAAKLMIRTRTCHPPFAISIIIMGIILLTIKSLEIASFVVLCCVSLGPYYSQYQTVGEIEMQQAWQMLT